MSKAIEQSNIVLSPVNINARKKIEIRPGDTVRVHQKIEEKGKTRIQMFEGLVIAVKHGKEAGGTFTVRKVSSGVGIERIFPLYSPAIEKIEVVKQSKVRRAKLYYIRDKVAREVKSKIKQLMSQTPQSTADFEKEETTLEPADQIDPASNAAEAEEVVEETKEPTEEKSEDTPEEAEKKEETEEPKTEKEEKELTKK